MTSDDGPRCRRSPSRSTARGSRPRRARRIWEVAQREGTEIPHLCHLPEPGYRADGNCRACMVEIEGERVLAASCIRKPAPGMVVQTATRARRDARADGLRAAAGRPAGARDGPRPRTRSSGAGPTRIGVAASRFPPRRRAPAPDRQPPGDGVHLDACIDCDALRPRLPRGPGQRRHRHGRPRPRREGRLRLRRPDGRVAPASPAANASRPARPAR